MLPVAVTVTVTFTWIIKRNEIVLLIAISVNLSPPQNYYFNFVTVKKSDLLISSAICTNCHR